MSQDNNLLRAGVAIVSMLMPVALPTSAFAGDDLEQSSQSSARFLRGAYGFSLSQSCVRAPFQPPPAAAFDPTTRQLLVDAELVSGFGAGQLKFAKDGVVTLEDGHLTEITANQLSAGSKPVSDGTRFSCTGSYSVQPGSKVGVSLSCNVVVPQPGPKVTLEPLNFEGFIAADRGSINLSTVKPEVHTVTVSNGGVVLQQRERICLQSMVLDKL
jgi:hypothetical protein